MADHVLGEAAAVAARLTGAYHWLLGDMQPSLRGDAGAWVVTTDPDLSDRSVPSSD